jgi:hypothetical protein
MFKGSLVALITPFRNHQVDESAFQEHVAWQIGQGTHGLVPCGTTGESPALADEEQKRVITLCVEVAKGRVPVVAGTGTNSTEHTIELTRQAKAAGADAALIVCPYYNKPTQEGLYQHFKAVHDAVDLPIVIYNIPGRSSVDMSVIHQPPRPKRSPGSSRGTICWAQRRYCASSTPWAESTRPTGCPKTPRSRRRCLARYEAAATVSLTASSASSLCQRALRR